MNRQLEIEFLKLISNTFNLLKQYICPRTDVFIINHDEAPVAATRNNVIYYNFKDFCNKYIHLYEYNYNDYVIYTKRFIVEVLIHELFHIEQDIVAMYYMSDDKYKSDIEDDVVYRTLIFQLQYANLIKNNLGVIIDEEEINFRLQMVFSDYIPRYSRYHSSNSYFINLLIIILHKTKLAALQFYLDNLENIKNLYLEINGVKYILKENYVYNNNYNELNIVTNRYFQFIDNGDIVVVTGHDQYTDSYTIKVFDYEKVNLFSPITNN